MGLEQILQRDVDPSIYLQFGNIPKPAYVLRGQWNYKPVMASNEAIPQIHIYTTDLKSDRTPPVLSTGIPLRVLGGRLAMRIRGLVSVQADNLPPTITVWTHDPDRHETPTDAELALILNHITEQTGLTCSMEMHPVWGVIVTTRK